MINIAGVPISKHMQGVVEQRVSKIFSCTPFGLTVV